MENLILRQNSEKNHHKIKPHQRYSGKRSTSDIVPLLLLHMSRKYQSIPGIFTYCAEVFGMENIGPSVAPELAPGTAVLRSVSLKVVVLVWNHHLLVLWGVSWKLSVHPRHSHTPLYRLYCYVNCFAAN